MPECKSACTNMKQDFARNRLHCANPVLKRRLIFLLYFFSGCFLTSFAQHDVKFTHLSNLDGLSQSTVQAILKDRYGFMWFGTQDGLNRYDGYSFKVYRHTPKDTTSLRRSHILSLYEDRQGNLWVGTVNGALSLYDRQHNTFKHFKEMSDNQNGLSQKSVTAIYEDKQNNFWIGTYWKLNLLDRKTGKVTQFEHVPADPSSLSNDGITCIFEDSRGNLWIGTSWGLNILDRKTKKFKRFFQTGDVNSISGNSISAITEDSYGRVWIGTGNGLNLFDHGTGTFTRFMHIPGKPNSLADNSITAIVDGGGGKLWVGTKNYLELFDTKQNTFSHFQSNPNVSTTLSKNGNTTALFLDNTGILWIGTYQGGLNKYDKSLTYFDTYQNNPQDFQSLSFNIVTSFAENPEGDIWIGTGGGALNLWKQATDSFIRFNPDPKQNSLSNWGVLCLYQGKKNNYLWIGTYGNCIDRYDPQTGIFKHYTKGNAPHQLNNDAVYAVFEDSRGNIWMGTNGGGVNVLNQETGIITKYVNDPNNKNTVGGDFIRCFAEDKDGNIWIGGTGGVSIFDPSKKTFRHYNQSNTQLESDMILSFLLDSKGNMWIGTLGGGLNKFDPVTQKISIYTTKDGLPDNSINSIIEDDLGYIWLSTNNGLSRFDPVRQIFKNNGLNNGIQSFEFSQGAGMKTRSGNLLFGGINGFNVINPANLIENKNVPPVVISGFKLIGKTDSTFLGGSDILTESEITLPYGPSIITFEFAALNFTASERNQYAYTLEGFNKTWNYIGTDRTATYTNLDPGEYVLRVKASNNDNVWNEQGTSIRVIITPPFWQTWWFRLLTVIATVGSIVLIYKMRVRAIKARQAFLEQQVHERTKSLEIATLEERKARQEADEANKELERKNKELEQFAYVASHDLQEPLRTTRSFVSLFHNQYKDKFDERGVKYLNFISQASERMHVLISDLLEYSRLGRKKEVMQVDCNALVNDVLADLGSAISETQTKIEITGTLPVINAYRTELKQVFQNLIINAIKFRKKGAIPHIKVLSGKKDGFWQFTVSDNGIGIHPKHNEKIFAIFQRLHTREEYEGSGIGLSHCRKIAELHKGKIWVDSEPGNGSAFHFTIHQNLS